MSTYFFEATPSEQEYLEAKLGPEQTNCVPWPLTTPDQLRGDAEDVTILSVFVHSQVTREIIESLPNLKLIDTRSTGFNHIDLQAATERGVIVCNVPFYGENTVAEAAFALLLALSHRIIKAEEAVERGIFDPTPFQGFDLQGKTLGVVGTGHIGQHSLKIGAGFGMRLIGYDAFPNEALPKEYGFEYRSLNELMAEADIITLHAPLLPTTQHMINKETLALLKPGAVLINTARGELIDTDALDDILDKGVLGGVGLDVLEHEDELVRGIIPQSVKRLMGRDNVVITPHSAYNTKEAVQRILDTAMENIVKFEAGAIQNQVKLP